MIPLTVEGFQRWLWILCAVALVCSLVYARRYPVRRSFAWFFTCAFVIPPVVVNLTQRMLPYAAVITLAVFAYGMYLMFKPYYGDPNTPR